ncbi:hypothetical protein, conserved [Eimeria praecox]|uniref:Uncharacterized protein n=1 Tax=Eimeria praecox TaxID=51316 RepID=U6H0X8_9EIME|nr:hypothetical protein, conserved [Eimeria praecox]
METATSKGAPSLWGPPNTVASFLLQAFACPAPWSPRYIPPGIRSRFISAGFPQRSPPLGTPEAGALGALGELLSDCTLTASDDQYKSILTFGSYDKFEKPDMVELLACITLIAVSPLTAQQLQLLIEKCLGASLFRDVSLWRFCVLVFKRLFLPFYLLFFVYLYIFLTPVSLPLVVAAAAAAAALLSLPAAAPAALSPFVCCFLLPCYSFLFPIPILLVVGLQWIACALAIVRGGGELSTLRNNRGHLIPFADHRSMQMIVTCAAILGVDFLTFPRKFCKSVNSGVTLVSETEYGLHWNFYMTLMVVFVFGELVCEYSGHPYKAGAVGLLLLVCYQIIISSADLDEWMMEGPRTSES